MDPHNTWIYYQLIVAVSCIVIAVASAYAAYHAVKFLKDTRRLMVDCYCNFAERVDKKLHKIEQKFHGTEGIVDHRNPNKKPS